MAGCLTRWWWGGDPDRADPVSGLTLRDIYYIRKSWAPVHLHAADNGLLIFMTLFTKDPATKSYFDKLHNKTDDEIKESKPFKAHIVNLMASFNLAVTNLHEPDLVVEYMRGLGEKHGAKKVKKRDFETLKTVLVEIFTDVLKLDEATHAAWGRFITFIYGAIFERLGDNSS